MASHDQTPIGSGFGRSTTAAEVLADLDLSGRNYIVTGGHSGIGLETDLLWPMTEAMIAAA